MVWPIAILSCLIEVECRSSKVIFLVQVNFKITVLNSLLQLREPCDAQRPFFPCNRKLCAISSSVMEDGLFTCKL